MLRQLTNSFKFLGLIIWLSGCIGGGGSSDGNNSQTSVTSTITDTRVASVTLLVTNNFQRANGVDRASLTVIARDNNDNPLADVAVTFHSQSDRALFSTLKGVTGTTGRLTITVTDTTAETFTVTAMVDNKASNTESLTFTAPVGNIALQASEQVLSVDETTTITLIIRQQNLLENSPLPDTPFHVEISGKATINNVPEKTNEIGQATFTITDHQKETVTLTATSGLITQTLKLFFGAQLQLLPETINAVGTARLTALLKDGYQSPIVGQTITFNFVDSNQETLTPISAITTLDGTAIVTITDVEKNGGSVKINAQSGKLTAQAKVNFLATFGENRQLQVNTTANVLNLNQIATITAKIVDKNNLPIVGQPVTFTLTTLSGSKPLAQINSANSISNTNGEVEATVTDTIGETVIVTVRADTAQQQLPLYFGATLHLSPTQSQGIADGTKPVTLNLAVTDAQGAGIAGIPINLRFPQGHALLNNFRPITNNLGKATINVTNRTVETVQLEAQVETLTPLAIATIEFIPSEPNTLILTIPVETLSLNGEATVTAEVKDNQGNSVIDGTKVNFTVTGAGTITPTALTRNGKAQAILSATTQAGLTTITATAGNISNHLTITVQPGSAGTIEVKKIDPQVIGVTGSGVVQSATITFLVKDSLGNLVIDGTTVQFSLGKTTLGGGETISTEGSSGKTAVGRTNNGLVSVTLKSGHVAGNIDVIATVNDTVSTVARITIAGSTPDAHHLSLAAEFHNLAGGVTFGLLSKITAYVGDRFGNIVPNGTAVSFISEGGTIGTSIGGGIFTTTTQLGQATATLQTTNPTTPLLGGIPKLLTTGYQCSYPYTTVTTTTPTQLCGNPGLVTIVAFTTGSESFTDLNGNGYYDEGEPFDDLPEPFIDGNDNHEFESGELYIDVNGNGQFDSGNQLFDGTGGKSPNTTIWLAGRVLFSAATAPLQVTSDGDIPFNIPNGGSQTFTVNTFSDTYGNALVAGTTFKVTTNNGMLGGTTDFTFNDNSGRGLQSFSFTLSSIPYTVITTGTGTVIFDYPFPSAATITITISSPIQDKAPGGNGDQVMIISGTINVE